MDLLEVVYRLCPSDGRFSWIVNQRIVNPWSPGLLPVFKNHGSDRVNGYHDLQYIPWVWNGINQSPAPIHFTENDAGQPVLDVRYPGDGKDAFREGHNEVFSPWSNPNSYKTNRTTTPFGFKINSLLNGVYSIDIYVNTAVNAPPSKPQDVKVTVNGYLNPVVTWIPNIEPDIPGGQYKIWRTIIPSGEPTSYNHVGTVNIPGGGGKGPATYSWTDQGITYCGGGNQKLIYTVSAVDNTGLESVKAEYDWLPWSNIISCKEGVGNNEHEIVISEYKLYNNYPNPFNPTTKIRYEISKITNVNLKVINIIGEELAILVDEIKYPGNYEVEFNAAALSSGVYIAVLQTNEAQLTRVMLLIK
jgi:hypothetical protein